MRISDQALAELRVVVQKEWGEASNKLTDDDLRHIGSFLITLDVLFLKVMARQRLHKDADNV
ncbi:MAG: hypothetical protein AAF696_30455 [Bacteroidota bacterium]